MQLETDVMAQGFQISERNPILGLESRTGLLRGLGKSLLERAEVFGQQGRPGNVVGTYCSYTSKGKKLTSFIPKTT